MTLTPEGQKAIGTSAGAGVSAIPVRMRAIIQDGYGSAEVLHLAEMPRPGIAGSEVLIQVRAAGLDRGTWHVTRGMPRALRLAYGLRKPKNPIPGLDLAGTVEAVGAAVTRFTVGEEVYGFGKGPFAEFAVAAEGKIARKPVNLTFTQAAVVPVSASTALQALRAAGPLAPGQKVLVLGASGGVGSYAVQLAKASGAEVTGVCSTTKREFVSSLGADHVIDYLQQDFANVTEQYDLILDIAGNPTVSRLRRALARNGTAVITGGEEGGSWIGGMDRQFRAMALSPFIGQRFTMVIARQAAGDLDQLTGLLEAGTINPVLDRTYPLEQVPEAMRYFDAGKTRGKIAITL